MLKIFIFRNNLNFNYRQILYFDKVFIIKKYFKSL